MAVLRQGTKALRNTGPSTRSQRPSVCWRRREGGEVHTLQKAMFDATKTLRMENVTRRARALHPDDARR